MKWSARFSVAAIAAIWSVATAAATADTNIAVIDVARVFEEYQMTQDLEAMFDDQRRAVAEEAEQRRDGMDQMRRALSGFDPSSEDFARREKELMRAEVEFQVWTGLTEKRLKTDHKQWLLEIYRRTQATVATIARQRKVDLVLTYDRLTEDAPDSVALRQQILLQKVIYHADQVDITDELLDSLNREYRAAGGIQSLDARRLGSPTPDPRNDKPPAADQ